MKVVEFVLTDLNRYGYNSIDILAESIEESNLFFLTAM